jgi:hypothetical protein
MAKNMPTTQPEGSSAIRPPVTVASIRAYVTSNPSGGGIVAENIQVTGVQFMTAGQLRTLLNNPAVDSYPPAEPVVYVTLSGDFRAPDPDQSAGNTPVYHTAFRVFSARTGNELMGGANP